MSSPPHYAFIFVFLIALTVAFSTEEPYFVKSPQNVEVIQGNPVVLPCKVMPDEGITYSWELNGSKVMNTTRRYQNGSNLHINRVDRERDSGQFTCVATSPTTSITSSEASLNIQWMDDAVVQLQEPEMSSLIQKGKDIILRCHVDASGDVHFEWFRNADRLAKTDRVEIKKKKLHIKAVQPSDNGIYKCIASNRAGTKESSKTFILAVPGDQTALIQIAPENEIVKKGSNAYFHCQYQHADVIEWYFRDMGPLESDNKTIIHSNGTIQVNDVQELDQGLYNCVGIRSESAEVPQSYTAELKIAYINNFTKDSFEPPLSDNSEFIVAAGSLFQLTCLEPDSLPPAKKWWTNKNGHIVSDNGDVKVDDDGRLIIEEVKEEHSGNYSCFAENIAGIVKKNIELTVTTKPTIINHPTSVTVNENEPTLLTCDYESNSRQYTTILWRKDNKSINHDYDSISNHQRIKIFKNNGTLFIPSTQTNDRGEYICEIKTIGFPSILSQPATISVIEELKFSPPPVNKKLELGSIAKVHCKAQGTPPPLIHWEKEGIKDNFPNHITDMNGTLHFNGVQSNDKGKYRCFASNSQGNINVTINIDVVISPKFSVIPKNPTEVTEGQSVLLDCVVEGDPKPTIQWDKNLKMNDFDEQRFTVLPNGTLFINEVHRDDENKYGCTAGSSAGLNRKEVQLIVHSRDGYHNDTDGDSTVTKAVLITMSVAGAYIILVIGLMVWCRYRRKSRKLQMSNNSKAENGDVGQELKDGANGHCSGTSQDPVEAIKEGQKSDGAETTHSQSSGQSKKSKSNYDKLALSRSNFKELTLIGRGEFGDVLLSKISKTILCNEKRNSQVSVPNGSEDDKELPVMIKALSMTKDENSLAEFKRELDMFTKLSHDNVTKLLGLCREAEPHYMILEYTDWGDLKQFLIATQKGTPPPLTIAQRIAIIQHLNRGMEHLSSMRLVHKDLAARNCLVTSNLLAKIGLPRLTRDPYSQEYCKHMNQIIPLRWLPYEAVYEDEYSTKSDVYSFAVLILEIFSQGELPFPKMNDNSFLTKLKEKKLEWKPHETTPNSLQQLQIKCWDTNPKNRPLFTDIAKSIEEILNTI